MSGLKRINSAAISAALERALRYRLLNEPLEAESICLDVLATDPDNQQAQVTLLLALTDQFETEFMAALHRAKEVLGKIRGRYERAYYEGVIHERWAKAQLARGMAGHAALDWFRAAMRCYEQAEKAAPTGDPDPVLRWNTCARILARKEMEIREPVAGAGRDLEAEFGDEVPFRPLSGKSPSSG